METSLVFIACILLSATQAADWSYKGANGVDEWSTVNANCDGTKQSPINIETLEATADSNLGTIQFSDSYSSKPSGYWEIVNNGHAVGVTPGTGEYTMRGGGLGDTYKLVQFHFHWGSANWQGSDHTINGKKYPMEIQFAYYNTKYVDISAAIDKADGLAFLGFFYEMDDNDNAALTPIVDKLTDVVFSKNKTAIAPMTISDLMGGDLNDVSDFYRYFGSLTSPGCFESVTWTVFAKTLPVSAAQATIALHMDSIISQLYINLPTRKYANMIRLKQENYRLQ